MSLVGLKQFNENLLKFMKTKKFKNMTESERLQFAYRAVSSGTILETYFKKKR